jgi:MipA family protein
MTLTSSPHLRVCAVLLSLLAPALVVAADRGAPASAEATPGVLPATAPLAEPPVILPAPVSNFGYQIGLAVVNGPVYAGAAANDTSFKPVWSLRYGRFRLTSSRASLIERDRGQGVISGASMELGEFNRWRFDAALRVDSGRNSADSPRLSGLPDIETTLRGRLTASYKVTVDTSLDFGLASDLLGRAGGTTLGMDLTRRIELGPGWRWSLGGGLGLADATYMRSYHGTPASLATTTGQTAYVPGAGLHDLRLGTGLTWQVAPSWRLGSMLVLNHLLGPAADSPLTEQASGVTLTLGLVYSGGR